MGMHCGEEDFFLGEAFRREVVQVQRVQIVIDFNWYEACSVPQIPILRGQKFSEEPMSSPLIYSPLGRS